MLDETSVTRPECGPGVGATAGLGMNGVWCSAFWTR